MKLKISILSSLTFILLIIKPGNAAGLGPFYSFDIGKSEFGGSRSDYGYTFRLDNIHHTAGLLIDTNVSKNSLFSYRCSIGYGFGKVKTIKRDHDSGNQKETKNYEIYTLSVYHTFGFGLIRKKRIKFWLGPNIGNAFENDIDRNEYFAISLEIGASIGFNLNFGRLTSLTFESGMRFKYQFIDSIVGYHGFLNLGLLFRISDTYRDT